MSNVIICFGYSFADVPCWASLSTPFISWLNICNAKMCPSYYFSDIATMLSKLMYLSLQLVEVFLMLSCYRFCCVLQTYPLLHKLIHVLVEIFEMVQCAPPGGTLLN